VCILGGGGPPHDWMLECAGGLVPVGMQSLGSWAAKQAVEEERLASLCSQVGSLPVVGGWPDCQWLQLLTETEAVRALVLQGMHMVGGPLECAQLSALPLPCLSILIHGRVPRLHRLVLHLSLHNAFDRSVCCAASAQASSWGGG
jgi:hypothetical protein